MRKPAATKLTPCAVCGLTTHATAADEAYCVAVNKACAEMAAEVMKKIRRERRRER